MVVKDIYLATEEYELVEINDYNGKNLYVGCCSDIPAELFHLIVYRISHNSLALIIRV